MTKKDRQPQLEPGTEVWYVPHADYWNDVDRQGTPVFEFVHDADSRPAPGQKPGDVFPGGVVANHHNAALYGPVIPHPARPGVLVSGNGQVFKLYRPRQFWKAVVVESEGGKATLEIHHPNGYEVHTVPGVPHDPDKALHTFHLPGEGE